MYSKLIFISESPDTSVGLIETVPEPSDLERIELIQAILFGVFPSARVAVPLAVQFVVASTLEISSSLKNLDVLLDELSVKCTLGSGKLPEFELPHETPCT